MLVHWYYYSIPAVANLGMSSGHRSPVSLTGKLIRKQEPKYVEIDLDKEEDRIALYSAIARGVSIRKSGTPLKAYSYRPLLHHPLPASDAKPAREATLRKVMYAELDRQVLTAVVLNDAWVLEECYMNGASTEIADKNGFTPLHIAAQMNYYDCVMVLCNIGVNVNARTKFGDTALYIAEAGGSTQAAKILREHKGVIEHDAKKELSGSVPLLEIKADRERHFLDVASSGDVKITKLEDNLKTPHRYKLY